ncbi:hypothetical protein BDR22DRAFT_272481 [Usnea florida]
MRLPSRFRNHFLRPYANPTLLTHIMGYNVYRISSPRLRLIRMTPAPAIRHFFGGNAAMRSDFERRPRSRHCSNRKWHINGPHSHSMATKATAETSQTSLFSLLNNLHLILRLGTSTQDLDLHRHQYNGRYPTPDHQRRHLLPLRMPDRLRHQALDQERQQRRP